MHAAINYILFNNKHLEYLKLYLSSPLVTILLQLSIINWHSELTTLQQLVQNMIRRHVLICDYQHFNNLVNIFLNGKII